MFQKMKNPLYDEILKSYRQGQAAVERLSGKRPALPEWLATYARDTGQDGESRERVNEAVNEMCAIGPTVEFRK